MNGNLATTALAASCVVVISIGQLLFRQTGLAIEHAGTLLDKRVGIPLLAALAAYGLATLAWIHVLRSVPLSLAYPVMGLSFVLVPLFGALFLREYPTAHQMAGAALILSGIVLANWGP